VSCCPPKGIVERVCGIGRAKNGLSWSKLLVLGFLAGAFIAFGGLLALTVGGGMPGAVSRNPGLQKFVFGSVFPVGLILVVIAGAELFTGNTACCIPALLKDSSQWKGCTRN